MSNLRVTDVQDALRHFVRLGHDVITDPRAVHMTNHPDEEPKPYRMAVGHTLNFDSHGMVLGLGSEVMQSERPLISHIYTSAGDPREQAVRTVGALIPTMSRERMLAQGAPDSKYHHFSYDTAFNSSSGPALHLSQTRLASHPSLFHNENQNGLHEALEAHKTKAVSHSGIYWSSNEQKRQMTPEEMTNFDVHHALTSLIHEAQPFKGLVAVRHGLRGMYHYNPATEELHEQ